ncbi:MAG: hypothetical protein IT374_22015 [Polyangiaceae bacterium]|nr:hypothetical protein [Polyangiaceae bacterium]
MSPRGWAGLAALCLVGVAKGGCGAGDELAPSAGAGAGGAGKGGGGGKSGKAGQAGKAGSGGKVWGPGGAGGKAGTAGVAGGAGCAGCPMVVSTGVDGYVPATPCPADYECGPGCTPVFSVPYTYVNLSQFWFDPAGVVDTARHALLYRGAGATETMVVGLPEGDSGFAHPTLSPSYLVARHYTWPEPKAASEQNYMHVYDRATGKLAYAWSMPGTEGGPSRVYYGAVATDKYVVLTNGGALLRFDLAKGGEPKILGSSNCWVAQLVGNKYLCPDDSTLRFMSVDIETGETEALAPGPSMQADGACALDGSACAWVDYRDPPADKSTYSNRLGGEVYRFELGSKRLERLTFDSPADPHVKTCAMVEGDLTVWQQKATPPTVGGTVTAAAMDRLYRDDRATGMRCRYPLTDVLVGGLYQRQVYIVRFDNNFEGTQRVAKIDLDSPEIPWECEPAPSPVVVP